MTNQDFGRAAELKQQITELEEQKEILESQENSFSQTVREEKVISLRSKLLTGVCFKVNFFRKSVTCLLIVVYVIILYKPYV